METRLESLYNTLLENELIKEEVLEDMVLKYFLNQNSKTFFVEGVDYTVLSQGELDDEMYTIAEDLYYDYISKLEARVEESRGKEFSALKGLVDLINEDQGVQIVLNTLDEEEDYYLTYIGKSDSYYIYGEPI